MSTPMSAGLSSIPTTLSTAKPAMARDRESRYAVAATVIAVVAVLNAIGVLLVLRRYAGALSEDLPRDVMLLTALATAAVAACARIAWRRSFPLESAGADHTTNFGWDRLVGYGSSSALLLFAVGCSFPSNRTSDWLIWLPLLVADQFWRQSFFDAGQVGKDFDIIPSDIENEAAIATLAFPGNAVAATSSVLEDQPCSREEVRDDQVVQQLFRVRDQLDREVVYGTLRADFQAGQRRAVVHVGFCPPLSHLPEIEAESIPGSAARIKVVQALAHGARMDVRLPSPAEADCHVWIDMAATPAMAREDHEEIGA